jgi:hypothetical protein
MARQLTRIIHIPIQDTIPEWDSLGARPDLRSVPGSAAPGAIAIGAAATSTSTEITISTRITSTPVIEVKVASGHTIHLTVVTRPTIGEVSKSLEIIAAAQEGVAAQEDAAV